LPSCWGYADFSGQNDILRWNLPAIHTAIVAAVRKLIGPKVKLMIDFNQSQTTASAIERVLRLKEFDLTWVEEPVSADDLRGHRAVRDAVAPVPIQTGENWWFPRGMANAIAAGASAGLVLTEATAVPRENYPKN